MSYIFFENIINHSQIDVMYAIQEKNVSATLT